MRFVHSSLFHGTFFRRLVEFHGWSQLPGTISKRMALQSWLLNMVEELVLQSKNQLLQFKVMDGIQVQLSITHNVHLDILVLILMTIVLSFANSLSRPSLYFNLH